MKRLVEIARWVARITLVVLATICASVTLLGQTTGTQATAPPKTSPTPPPGQQTKPEATPTAAAEPAIPLPQIAPRAEELIGQLREMNDHLTVDSTLTSIDQTLTSQEELIYEKQHQLDDLLAVTPTLHELQDVEQEWLSLKTQYAGMRNTLTGRAQQAEKDLRFLEGQQKDWSGALNQLTSATAIESVFDNVRSVLSEIQNTSDQAKELLKSLLALQSRVSQQHQVVLDALKTISHAKAQLQRGLLEPDSPPIWHASSEVAPAGRPDHFLNLTFKRNLTRTKEFIKARRAAGLGLLTLFLISLVFFASLRRRILERAQDGTAGTTARSFRRPVSLALTLLLLVLMPLTNAMPAQVRVLIVVLSIAPVIRLLAPLTRPVFRLTLYLLVPYGIIAGVWETFVLSPGLRRWGLTVLSIAVIAIVVWRMRRNRSQWEKQTEGRGRLALAAIYVSVSLLLLSIAANVLGYVGLSRVVRTGTILSAYSGVVLYTACLMTAVFFRTFVQGSEPAGQSPPPLREIMSGWILRLVRWGACLMWVYLVLNFFTIREPVLRAISFALTAPIKVRAAQFTLADVVTFILVVAVGFGLAALVRVILSRKILSRLHLKQGISYAVTTITYYLLLLGVFLMALSAAGIELSKFTVLTGALGVGAGFGLQNVISNFVSGIILLFERPVRIGDFLEVDQATGEVIRIGMRSTSIRTPQGGEVIVPNSNLISRQVTNWTLTQRERRTELRVKVAYGPDPAVVSQLLVETALSHDDVVREPAPQAFFLGFGESSLDFELWLWVPKGPMPKKVNSEVALKIAHRLRKAGIDIAPRRELYVAGLDSSVKELFGAGGDYRGSNIVSDRTLAEPPQVEQRPNKPD